MLKGRLEIYEKVSAGKAICLVAELPPPSSSFSSTTTTIRLSLSDSTPLRLVGHCDIGPIVEYPFLSPLPSHLPLTHSTPSLEIYSLYVHPTLQRTGCAQRLFLTAAREGMRKFAHYAQRMVVVTFEVNYPARRFYEKLGGKIYTILEGYPTDGKLWNAIVYEWLNVEEWVQKWEQLYEKDVQRN
jgi:ribosomal protein S18 acetylase RimI-like enzyme